MKKNKSGFSILEVTLTFVIITIVSITAFSVFKGSGNSIVNFVHEENATTYLTNALEIYKCYGTEDGVTTKLGLNSTAKQGNYYIKEIDGHKVQFKIDTDGFSGACYKGDKLILEIAPYKIGGQNENA